MKGNGLRRLRLARGLSAAQLAEAVGASEAEVLRWEADELPPSGKLLALSAALGAEVEDILRAAQECVQFVLVDDALQVGDDKPGDVLRLPGSLLPQHFVYVYQKQ